MYGPLIRTLAASAGLVFFLVLNSTAYASGFAIPQQSARQTGSALAGVSTSAADAATVWYNPAAMSLMGNEFSVNATVTEPHTEFSDMGSSQMSGGGNVPLLPSGVMDVNGGGSVTAPGFFFVHRLGDNAHYGISINTPFAMESHYNAHWTGRYQTIESRIRTISINPALSYKFNKAFSIGIGADVNYADAHFTHSVDFAAICANLAGGTCPNGAMPGQGQYDGYAVSKASDYGYGYDLGALWRITPNTRLGLNFKSQIHHTMTGTSRFEGPSLTGRFPGVGSIGTMLSAAYRTTGNTIPLVLPADVSIGFYHRIPMMSGQALTLLANAKWTQWSTMKQLQVNFDNPKTPTSVQRFNWRNTWRFSLGADYKLNRDWAVRGGVAYDRSPIQNPALEPPMMPGSDATVLALGATRKITRNTWVDVAFTHDFMHDTYIHRTGQTGDMLNGHYALGRNTFSIQFDHKI